MKSKENIIPVKTRSNELTQTKFERTLDNFRKKTKISLRVVILYLTSLKFKTHYILYK